MKKIEREFSQLFLKVYFLIFLISFFGLVFKNSSLYLVIAFSFFLFFHIFKILRFKYMYTSPKFLLTYFLIFLLFIFHILFFPELNSIFVFRMIRFIFVCITICLVSQNMELSYYFFNKLKKDFNKIVPMLFFIDILFVLGLIEKSKHYSMGISYSLLFYLSLYSICKKNKKKIDYFKLFYMFSFILRYGSRGAILVYLVLIFLYKLNSSYFNKKYRTFALYIAFAVGGYYIFFKTNLIRLVFQRIASLGIKSRTIILFQQEGIHLSGRGAVYKNVYHSILDSPFSIKGIFSDFLVTGIDSYSHNIVLELLYQFGMIFGSFLVFLILFLFLKSVCCKQKNIQDNFIFIFAIISIIRLMVSGTLWGSVEFWTWIGLYLRKRYNSNSFYSDNID